MISGIKNIYPGMAFLYVFIMISISLKHTIIYAGLKSFNINSDYGLSIELGASDHYAFTEGNKKTITDNTTVGVIPLKKKDRIKARIDNSTDNLLFMLYGDDKHRFPNITFLKPNGCVNLETIYPLSTLTIWLVFIGKIPLDKKLEILTASDYEHSSNAVKKNKLEDTPPTDHKPEKERRMEIKNFAIAEKELLQNPNFVADLLKDRTGVIPFCLKVQKDRTSKVEQVDMKNIPASYIASAISFVSDLKAAAECKTFKDSTKINNPAFCPEEKDDENFWQVDK